MVAVIVNGPVREDDIRTFGCEQPLKVVVSGGTNHGFTVNLVRKPCLSIQRLASSPRFGNTKIAANLGSSARTTLFTTVQIQQSHVMASVRIPGDRAAAAIFRIAGMSARYDDFPLLRGRLIRGNSTSKGSQHR